MMEIEKYYRMLNLPSGDLRISITNGCNMKCTYCHNEGQTIRKEVKFLSVEDIKYLVNNAKPYGLKKVRLTGGEPLIHPEINEIVRMLHDELGISNIGINTNGLEIEKLYELCETEYLKQVVIGLDYFDSEISKDSPIGISSSKIRDGILKIRDRGRNIQIATVYNGNFEDIFRLVEWCLENQVLLKVIEKSDYWTTEYDPSTFDVIISTIRKRYLLNIGLTADLKEYYLFNDKSKILFFQSHCNRNECQLCKNMHMRITCFGEAKACINRADTTFPLLSGDFNKNFKRAIANLGNPPGNEVI